MGDDILNKIQRQLRAWLHPFVPFLSSLASVATSFLSALTRLTIVLEQRGSDDAGDSFVFESDP